MERSTAIVSAIVAAGQAWGIGKDNAMLWHLPDDFRYFKQTTSGHPVIMGRKTLQSLGKPLKNRTNIVVTRQQGFTAEGVEVFHDLASAIQRAQAVDSEEVFVIGGGEIYRQALPLIDRLYLTQVHHTFPEATAHFPAIDFEKWKVVSRKTHPADDRHDYAFTFLVLERNP